jgi:NAD(P)-dependent dehydrogenase (short-subunit alcohol dehydrogenase family)
MRLKDKIAIVTGAASGIGKTTAVLMGKEGAKVMCADLNADGAELNADGAEAVAHQIADVGGESASIQADVTKAAEVRGMVEATVERWGRLDVLFNNAGIEFGLPVTQVPEEQWDHLIDVNLKGVFLGCKAALPELAKHGGGAIVNTASIAGLQGAAWMSTYCASKGGVVLMTKALAVEWARQSVRVNAVCPGVIRTPMADQGIEALAAMQGESVEEIWQRIGEWHPMGRVGEAEEVARAVVFLASDEASFITGAALSVDGGVNAGSPPRQDPVVDCWSVCPRKSDAT